MVIGASRHGKTRHQRGYALLVVLLFSAVTLFTLGAALQYASSRAVSNERSTRHVRAQSAAEAATAKAAGALVTDFMDGGEPTLSDQALKHTSEIPNKKEAAMWADFQFANNRGEVNQTYIGRMQSWEYGAVTGLPGGGSGYRTVYRVESQAKELNTVNPGLVAVRQDVEMASVPLFYFSVFYDLDLEVNSPDALNIAGRVHSNGSLYTQPSKTVNFLGPVSASGNISTDKNPADPVDRTRDRSIFAGIRAAGVSAMNISSTARRQGLGLHTLLEVPPKNESITSELGKQRFYNQAELIIQVDDKGISAFNGPKIKGSIKLSDTLVNSFVSASTWFYDLREYRYVTPVDIDMETLMDSLASINAALGRELHTLYVIDSRSLAVNYLPSVRIIGGDILPTGGFTFATPNALYVLGNYNTGVWVTSGKRKKKKTQVTPPVPACLAADVVTLLSENWDDAYSYYPLSYRKAAATSVTAAILTGITPTRSGYYSGGLENAVRLLEDWADVTFTFKGAMAVLFESQVAKAPWGASTGIYDSPKRAWDFNAGFTTLENLPPSTPTVQVVTRTKPTTVEARYVR